LRSLRLLRTFLRTFVRALGGNPA